MCDLSQFSLLLITVHIFLKYIYIVAVAVEVVVGVFNILVKI